MRAIVRLGLAVFACVLSVAARADNTVTIGAIYPLGRDNDAKFAIETAADIVNTPHPGLEALPLGAGQGLTNLGGAKLAVTFADDLGNPSVAQAEALRLIAQDHVAALIGAGQSPETLAATALAERHGFPFLVPAAVAPSITGRGFKWVFRTTPLSGDIARVYAEFLGTLNRAGTKVDTIALVVEDSEFGHSAADALHEALKVAGFGSLSDIAYPANATELSPQVGRLRDLHPDVAIFVSHAADAILFTKTMKTLDYKPPIEIGDDAGFSDPQFAASVGNLAQGVIDRSAWTLGKPDTPTAIVNALYKAKSGHDLDDAGARVMQGFFALADAINRAGSTDPAAIRKALQETDLKPNQLIVGYKGVRFDASGQNALAATYLTQLQGKQLVTVWPAATAAGKLELPFKGWE
ncbi:MAG TPA: ABC transporter substrate-binding protein [Stellaceae bacterium]|nr:ABC transporter substrate-binding protein [Stellaceae bacterium]